MNARDRCMLALEISTLLARLWAGCESEHERQEIEAALMRLRPLVTSWCREVGIPH